MSFLPHMCVYIVYKIIEKGKTNIKKLSSMSFKISQPQINHSISDHCTWFSLNLLIYILLNFWHFLQEKEKKRDDIPPLSLCDYYTNLYRFHTFTSLFSMLSQNITLRFSWITSLMVCINYHPHLSLYKPKCTYPSSYISRSAARSLHKLIAP